MTTIDDLRNKKRKLKLPEKVEDTQDMPTLFNQLANAYKEVRDLSNKVADISKLQIAINNLTQKLQEVNSRITTDETEVDSIRQQIGKARVNELSSLITEVFQLKDEIEKSRTTDDNISKDVQTISSNLDQLKEKVQIVHQQNTDVALAPLKDDINMSGHRIRNLQDPSEGGDAVTKRYVDSIQPYIPSPSLYWKSGSGISSFTDLDDVDNDYTGDGGKYLRVKAAEDGIEFAAVAGGGDMLAATYDPGSIAADAFDTDNHIDGVTNGVYTLAERTKLAGVATGADVTADNAPKAHKASHENAGADEISVAGLSGLLADDQHVLDAEAVAAVEAAGLTFAENKGITLDAALSADGQYNATMMVAGTAGTNLSFGQAVYFAVADSKWELAKGDAEATVAPMTGIVVVAGNENAAITVMLIGSIRADAAFPALTVGAPVFISAATAGAVTSTELTTGQFQKAIGWAVDANTIILTGNPDWVKVA